MKMQSVIYLISKSPMSLSVLPSAAYTDDNRAGNPQSAVYMNLRPSDGTARTVTRRLVVSYTTFSPLPQTFPVVTDQFLKAVVFFCLLLLLPIASIFGSEAPYAARTFLSHPLGMPATDRDTAF